MAHSLLEIEKDALGLSPEDRARLAVRLISSLEESGESPEQIENSGSPRLSGVFKNCAMVSCRGYPPEKSSLSCGTKRGEICNLPPGSSGGDERMFSIFMKRGLTVLV